MKVTVCAHRKPSDRALPPYRASERAHVGHDQWWVDWSGEGAEARVCSVLVSPSWVEQCVREQRLVDPSSRLNYLPRPKHTISALPAFKGLVFSATMYTGDLAGCVVPPFALLRCFPPAIGVVVMCLV